MNAPFLHFTGETAGQIARRVALNMPPARNRSETVAILEAIGAEVRRTIVLPDATEVTIASWAALLMTRAEAKPRTCENMLAQESAHRKTAPLIDWCHVVRLPNGEHARINRFDYNTNERSSRYIQLADGAWIRANALTVVQL